MIVGLLLISMVAGGAVSVALAMLGQPVWVLLLAYMATGTAILMVELLIAARFVSGRAVMPQALTARFRAARLRQ